MTKRTDATRYAITVNGQTIARLADPIAAQRLAARLRREGTKGVWVIDLEEHRRAQRGVPISK
jgi:hypothetical protein